MAYSDQFLNGVGFIAFEALRAYGHLTGNLSLIDETARFQSLPEHLQQSLRDDVKTAIQPDAVYTKFKDPVANALFVGVVQAVHNNVKETAPFELEFDTMSDDQLQIPLNDTAPSGEGNDTLPAGDGDEDGSHDGDQQFGDGNQDELNDDTGNGDEAGSEDEAKDA